MQFVIQRINDKLPFDFCFEIAGGAYDFAKWRNDPYDIKYVDDGIGLGSTIIRDCVPIGSVEFVTRYYELQYPHASKKGFIPLNVPFTLEPYAGRMIWDVNTDNVDDIFKICENSTIFRKSSDLIKDPNNGFIKVKRPEDILNSQISADIGDNILSEWRVFVYHDKIRYIANYSGDCTIFPDVSQIHEMVDIYKKEAPVAYTLDVYVNNNCTYVMECHRFFSCGLYGFNDYSILPYMFSQEWHEIITL